MKCDDVFCDNVGARKDEVGMGSMHVGDGVGTRTGYCPRAALLWHVDHEES